MKELSIEEKAKAYEEVLAKVANCSTDKYGCIIGMKPFDLFSELKESEDERIRKELIKETKGCEVRLFETVTNDEFVAWLEKQGEKGTNGNEREITNSEQKPAWSEEDELSCFESALFTAFSDAWQSYLLQSTVNVKQWAKEHSKKLLEAAKEELKEQKPIAWSEEDEIYIENIRFAVEKQYPIASKDIVDWLKSLKGRVQPQPKQEWSKEDEYILDETIQHLEELIRIDKVKYCSVDMQYYQRDIDWLKSLRPKKQNK